MSGDFIGQPHLHLVEALVGFLALLSLGILWRLRSESDLPLSEEENGEDEQPELGLAHRPAPYSLGQIERSRYDQNGQGVNRQPALGMVEC